MFKQFYEVPSEISNWVELLRWQASLQAESTAYTYLTDGESDEIHITYGDLDRQARSIGALLQQHGKLGERVLILYPSGLEYIAAFLGCLYGGMIAVPAYPPRLNRPDHRLRSIAMDAQATIVLTTQTILSNIEQRFAEMPELAYLSWLATDNLPLERADDWQMPALKDKSLAFLQYTSGSTAAPKGVMVSHANLLHNEHMIQQAFKHTSASIIVGWLPLYHDMGLIGNVLQPLYVGAQCVLMSPLHFLQQPLRWLSAISHYGGTTSGGPNFAYELCINKIAPAQVAELDLSNWQVAFNGAEPVRPSTLERFAATFAATGFRKQAFYPCYGLAEATLFVTGGETSADPISQLLLEKDLEKGRVNVSGDESIGRAYVGSGHTWLEQKIAIVHPDTQVPCTPSDIGEIWISGPSVAQGYWQNPQETKNMFQARLVGGEQTFLRTGDLGFLQEDELFVTGRLKDLIIIRGRNHYPQDIELTAEQSHPALQPGAGAAFSTDIDGEERLIIVHEVTRSGRKEKIEPVADAIRRAIAEHHELQVYAVILLKPGHILKTTSGKIQRCACRDAYLNDALNAIGSSVLEYIADEADDDIPDEHPRASLLAMEPENQKVVLQDYLKKQASQVLKISSSQFDIWQPLINVGIDSLSAIELQSRLEASFGVTLPITQLLAGQNTVELADQILTQVSASLDEKIAPEAEHTPGIRSFSNKQREAWPLSFEQERLWLLDQLHPGNAAYHLPLALHLNGCLCKDALKKSITELLERHATLRTVFWNLDGKPAQHFLHPWPFELPSTNLTALSEDEQVSAVQDAMTREFRQPFDLASGPLIRAHLLVLSQTKHILLLTLHHMIADLWSTAILVEDLQNLYQACMAKEIPALPDLPIRYEDFVCWQREALTDKFLAKHLSYWKKHLADAIPMELPADRERPRIQSFHGAYQTFLLSKEISESLRQFSHQEGVTLFMTLLAAFQIILHRYSGAIDILVGSPTAGRTHTDLERLIGFFAYPLILRADFSGNPTFRDILLRVRDIALAAYEHQIVPFSHVMKALSLERGTDRHPLFQVMFSFLDKAVEITDSPLKFDLLPTGIDATEFDFFLTLINSPQGLQGVFAYNADMFIPETIQSLVDVYEKALENLIQRPNMHLADLELPKDLRAKVFSSRKETIAISATFTAEPLKQTLEFWFQKMGLSAEIAFTAYNQVFQNLFDPASFFIRNCQGVNIILIRLEDWEYQDNAGRISPLDQNIEEFILALRIAVQSSAVPYIVCICPITPVTLKDETHTARLHNAETKIFTALNEINGVHAIAPDELFSLYPMTDYYDAYGDKEGHIPYTPACFTALGTLLARKIYHLKNSPKKVIVLDCDHTLWKGVCGEDGVSGIELSAPYRVLQEFMLSQQRMGRLLCLCSKNETDDVMEVFNYRQDMPLKLEHLVAWRINWQSKSKNLYSLANELGLGLDSFIFIDDNPVECAEIRAHLPEVLTLQLPSNDNDIPKFLKNVWAFDHLKITTEDIHRTRYYRQNSARERFRQTTLSLEDFLKGLELQISISDVIPEQYERVAQLTQRTNQFNTTTIRRSKSEIRQLCQTDNFRCLTVMVKDRFGDYGLVGVVLFEERLSALQVDTFLLSCRVLGRRVEHHVLARLGSIALASEKKWVYVPYSPSARNQPIFDFLNQIEKVHCQPLNNEYVFRFPADSLDINLLKKGIPKCSKTT